MAYLYKTGQKVCIISNLKEQDSRGKAVTANDPAKLRLAKEGKVYTIGERTEASGGNYYKINGEWFFEGWIFPAVQSEREAVEMLHGKKINDDQFLDSLLHVKG